LNGKKRGIKGFFKKIGQAVKKGGKFFLRINPITISARAGFLLAMKLNLKKMASKLKWGYATKEQAAAKGISTQAWEQSKNALAKIEKLFVGKLQGKGSALKNAVLKGKAGGLNGIDEETEISGLGIAPAAALAAAIPVITSALKIMVDSGAMKKGEADDIQSDVTAKVSEAEKLADDPDIKNSGNETASASSASDESNSKSSSDGGSSGNSSGGGIVGFIKKQPLIAIGGAALGIWGLSKLMGGKKSSHQGVSGVPNRKRKKHKPSGKSPSGNTFRKGKRRLKSITLK
jgi:hypothetical protein